MLTALHAKFSQNEKLKDLLLSTGDAVLIEDSPFDQHWGVGKRGDGVNRFGNSRMTTERFLYPSSDNSCPVFSFHFYPHTHTLMI
jgi:predicted NAD-dependent protein-ADP-ribosyltransferase YbiA (DUF1768 family)